MDNVIIKSKEKKSLKERKQQEKEHLKSQFRSASSTEDTSPLVHSV